MPADFTGRWKLTANENVMEFLSEMGMTNVKNKTVTAGEKETIIEIEQTSEGRFTLKGGPKVDVFTIGEPYSDELSNGKKFVGDVKWDGDHVIIDAKDQDGREVITTRKIVGDELILTRELVGKVTLKRIFKKQQ